jgi:hypothetical protein
LRRRDFYEVSTKLARPRLVSLQLTWDGQPMISTKKFSGRMLSTNTPTWQPLIDLVGEKVEEFMWMFEVELEDEHRLHAYKHWWTRRYIHLTPNGQAFAYEYSNESGSSGRPGWYRETDSKVHLELVLPRGQQLFDYRQFLKRARQDSNLRPLPPEGSALSS